MGRIGGKIMIELSDEKIVKLNELIGIFVTDERLKWYLAGLMDGYKIHGRRKK